MSGEYLYKIFLSLITPHSSAIGVYIKERVYCFDTQHFYFKCLDYLFAPPNVQVLIILILLGLNPRLV